jgi:elongation factor P
MLTFMDTEDYSQYTLSVEDLEEEAGFITEDMEDLMMMLVDDLPVGVQLPTSVCLEIVETSPSIKGATVTKRTKPAKLSTGLEVQVPEYISQGETIRVNTESGEYMSRA